MRAAKITLVILLCLAWFLLIYRLNEVPPGLQHDEVFDAVDAQRVLTGSFPIYFPANYGRNPAFIYSVAAIFKLTQGHWVWSIRFASTLWAMPGLALTFALARRNLRPISAVLAVALMAGSFWFMFVGRLGLEPVSLLPLALAFFYMLDRATRQPSPLNYALAGIVGGLANYAYLAARLLYVLPVLLALHATLGLLLGPAADYKVRRRQVFGPMLTLAVMLAVSAPLLLYLQIHPGQGDTRVAELSGPLVAALHGQLGPLLHDALDTIRAIGWGGSAMLPYQYNLPGRAALQPVLAVLFVIGFVVTVVRLRHAPDFLLLCALGLGLAPSLITGGDALAMRGMYALPLLFVLAARGAETLFVLAQRSSRWAAQRAAGGWPVRAIPAALLIALLLWQVADSANAYFNVWARAEQTQRIYNADFRLAARYASQQARTDQIFIGTDRLINLDSLAYTWYEPPTSEAQFFRLPYNPPVLDSRPVTYLGPAAAALPPLLETLMVAGAERGEVLDDNGRAALWRVRVTPDVLMKLTKAAQLAPLAHPLEYEGALRLDATGLEQASEGPRLITRWTVLGPWPHPAPAGMPLLQPKLALALLDENGYTWAQTDAPAGLPVHDWLLGRSLLEITPITLPGDMPPGQYGLRVVLYDDEAGPLKMQRESVLLATPPIATTMSVSLRPAGPAPSAPYQSPSLENKPLRSVGLWERLERLLAGNETIAHLTWQAESDLLADGLSYTVSGFDGQGEMLWQQSEPVTAALPAVWPAGRVFRLAHAVRPANIPVGQTAVRLSVCVQRQTLTLGCADVPQAVVINTPPIVKLPTAPRVQVDARWNEAVSLIGYDLDRTEGRLRLKLYWQASGPSAEPLKRFIHVLDEQDHIVAQSDVLLANGDWPATAWRPGEYVLDQADLLLPNSVAVQKVCVGVYDQATEKRLAVSTASGETLPDDRFCFR